MFVVSEAWTTSFSSATAGFLTMRGVTNPDRHAGLDERARLLEAERRQRFAGIDRAAMKAQEPLPAYAAHYRKYGKTYHVLLQFESVALKGKSIPPVAAL